ncbi:probable ATP-dependent DNA helicase HFM1 [Dromiciops gliroides]|uniref:probable ATP-dependent DNA helicase HFM1 n=1 Tax=Dromiciops gliroides TaxID=33562 RepID=UPI001CC64DD5|nr:probable ATP-dependent DNA helicase HFM1 [Dromiciops gliroides]
MFNSDDCPFSLNSLFFVRPDQTEEYTDDKKPSCWFLPSAPLISEIPDTQVLQGELERFEPLEQTKNKEMFTSHLKTPNEATNYMSPAHEFQLDFYSNKSREMKLNLEMTDEDCLPAGPAKQSSGFVHQYQNQLAVEPTGSIFLGDRTFLDSPEEEKSETIPSTFRKKLFKTSNCSYRNADCNGGSALNFHIGPVENLKTKMNKGELWKNSVSKQNPLYPDVNLFTTKDALFASDIGEGIFKTQNLTNAPESLGIQGTVEKDVCSLKSVTEIPAQFRSIFKEFPYFNYIQSKALDDLLYTDRNFVVCAPTGSGKTVIFELAITRLLMEVPLPWLNIKIVYMAPIKALCSQRFDDWKKKFGPIGLTCKELTGDTAVDDLFEIQHAHIIMTTPEKWDSMTRKWRDNSLVQLVRLFLIDEVHVVKDENRGPTLEVVITRMKTISSLSQTSENSSAAILVRFVAVSATIPNAEDIAEWLSDGKRPAKCLKIDEKHRPVKLRKVVLGFPWSSNQTEFKFDLSLNYKVASVIQTYSDQKPTLVFCATRKGVQQAASVLSKNAKFVMTMEQKQRLQKYTHSIRDYKLRDLLTCGVGYHHAGMELSERKIVEGAFTVGDLPVLFTTSTLAMGVNLPAHLVVIKSTMHYAGGMFEEYSESDILQMIGRAGRPQFDTTATAVIMTRLSTREKYAQMLTGTDTIESSLHRHLIEHLNAEIVLHTITDVNVALEWIRSTLLYIRALKNPAHYGFASGLDKNGIESKLQDLCLKNLNDLSSVDLIKMDEDVNFKSTEAGRLMAWYYITFETVKKFCTIKGRETLSELVTMIASCKEFLDIQLRISEKKTLNILNKDQNKITIRFPMGGRIKTREMKVNCLIQAQLGCLPIQDFALTQDTAKIFRSGTRITKWLSECLAAQEKKFAVLLNSLILAKCFRAKLWENSLHVSKQLEKIGVTLSNAMVNAGLTSFKKIEEVNARELELILNRHPPFGNQIKETVIRLPKYELDVEQISRYSNTVAEILVTVFLRNFEQLQTKRTAPDSHYVTLLIGDADNRVVYKHKLMDSVLLKTGNWTKKIDVQRALQSEELSINLISSEYVGLDIQQKFTAFYIGPNRFENQMVMQRNSETETHSRHSDESTCSRRNTCKISGNRDCHHHCKSKETCGHDCCKIGVAQKSEMRESKLSSYLTDLRHRDAISSVPPVKRLKMQINKSQNVDLKKYSFTRRALLPVLPRSKCTQMSASSLVKKSDSPEVCEKSQQPLQSAYYGEKDLSTWKYSTTLSEESHHRVFSNRNLNSSVMHNLTDTDKNSSPFSDSLNVNFELGDEVWDDFNDDKLINANNFLTHMENTGTSGGSGGGGSSSSITGSSHLLVRGLDTCFCLSPEKSDVHFQDSIISKFNMPSEVILPQCPGNTNSVHFQERQRQMLSPEIERVRSTVWLEKEANTSHFNKKWDFFVSSSDSKKVTDLSAHHSDDEESEMKAFLGIFDGIF